MGVPWKGVDLDGTLAIYNSWEGPTVIGEPVPKMLKRVKTWLENGYRVKILTARVNPKNKDYLLAKAAIEQWCIKHIGTMLEVTCEKDYDMVELWDDRAVRVMVNTGEIL